MNPLEASAVRTSRAKSVGSAKHLLGRLAETSWNGTRAARLLVSSLAALGLACQKGPPRAGAPVDAGTVVTVYVAPELADRLMGRLTAVAARHRWSLSVRTDTAARTEADLAIVDSAGTLVGRLRAGAAAASEARQLAEAVLP